MKRRSPVGLALGATLAMLASLVLAPPAPAGHLRPLGASPIRVPLVPYFLACTSPTPGVGGNAPLVLPACQPPTAGSQFLQVGTPDVNAAPAQSTGLFRVIQITGDATFQFSLSDVRCRPATAAAVCVPANAADGPDYVGELEATFVAKITTHDLNTNQAGTLVNVPFPVTILCGSTANTIGSICALTTSYNAVVPGVIKPASPNHRSVWEYSQIQVNDGGQDGVVSTSPNTQFMVQGMFFP